MNKLEQSAEYVPSGSGEERQMSEPDITRKEVYVVICLGSGSRREVVCEYVASTVCFV